MRVNLNEENNKEDLEHGNLCRLHCFSCPATLMTDLQVGQKSGILYCGILFVSLFYYVFTFVISYNALLICIMTFSTVEKVLLILCQIKAHAVSVDIISEWITWTISYISPQKESWLWIQTGLGFHIDAINSIDEMRWW